MSLADKIIDQVDSGVPYKQVASAHSWQAIGPEDRHRLFSEAESRSTSDEKSIALLSAILRMAENAGDTWCSARAIALILRRPDVPLASKHRGLEQLRKTLDQIRSTLAPQDGASTRRYTLHLADYYALNAEVTQEEGSLEQVLDAYRAARAIWEKNGVKDKVSWADEQIALLDDMRQSQQSLLPLELLTGERTNLQKEIAKLQADVRAITQELSSLDQQAHQLRDDAKRLDKEVQAKLAQTERLRSQEEEGTSRLRSLSSKIKESEAALQFVIAMPRAATAPLWLEVLRLALAQGKIDALALQAMERLSIQCSEEGLPVLAEIVARLPDGQRVDPAVFLRVSTDWVVGTSQAMAIAEKDPEGAARALVEAWSMFLGERREEAESAG
jgi:hypothetical protein